MVPRDPGVPSPVVQVVEGPVAVSAASTVAASNETSRETATSTAEPRHRETADGGCERETQWMDRCLSIHTWI